MPDITCDKCGGIFYWKDDSRTTCNSCLEKKCYLGLGDLYD